MKIIFIFWVILFANFCRAQDTCKFDNNGLSQGFWELPSAMTILKYGKEKKSFEAKQYGYFIDNKKQGCWDVKDKHQHLVGQKWYNSDTLIVEIQYTHQRVSSIIHFTTKYQYTKDPDLSDYVYIYQEIINFNKYGKIKKRSYRDINGEVKTINY